MTIKKELLRQIFMETLRVLSELNRGWAVLFAWASLYPPRGWEGGIHSPTFETFTVITLGIEVIRHTLWLIGTGFFRKEPAPPEPIWGMIRALFSGKSASYQAEQAASDNKAKY